MFKSFRPPQILDRQNVTLYFLFTLWSLRLMSGKKFLQTDLPFFFSSLDLEIVVLKENSYPVLTRIYIRPSFLSYVSFYNFCFLSSPKNNLFLRSSSVYFSFRNYFLNRSLSYPKELETPIFVLH